MAITGTRQDRFLTAFTDMVTFEVQQEGTRLSNLFKTETMKGQKTFFNKLGKLAAPRQKNARNEAVILSDNTYEKRQITFETIYDAHGVDINDLLDMISDPTNDLVRAIGMNMGRDMDRIIMNAISGNAVVTSDGSTSNVTLLAGNTIAVSDISYDFDQTAGDKGLTPGKLMKAVKLMKQQYVPGEFVVIAPAGQIANVLAHARASSGDYVTARPLESAGFESSLSGYLGLNFISYEETGVDSNSDELVYVVSRDAVKIGQRKPLNVEINDRPDLVKTTQIKALYDMGATRIHEEAVVKIACDPRKA